jgi:hypothetical protein
VHWIADLSLLSIDALDDLLSNDSLRVESEDALLAQLFKLGSASRSANARLLNRMRLPIEVMRRKRNIEPDLDNGVRFDTLQNDARITSGKKFKM